MMRDVRPAVRRALAITLLIAPVYALIVWVVQPVVEERRQLRLITEQATISLGRYRQILREHATEQPLAQISRARSDLGFGLVGAANETLAAVELQNRMRALVQTSNGELHSMQMLATRSEGKLRRISLRVQVALDIDGLRKLIHTTESSGPFLFIDGMEIRLSAARPSTQSDQTSPGDGPRSVEMRLDVSAYMRPRAS